MKPHLKNVCFVRFSQGDKRCCWIGSHWLDLAVISSALKSKVIFLFSNPSHFPGFSCVYLFLLLFQSPSVLWIRIQTSCVISVYQLHLRLTPTMSDWPSEEKKIVDPIVLLQQLRWCHFQGGIGLAFLWWLNFGLSAQAEQKQSNDFAVVQVSLSHSQSDSVWQGS